MTKEQHMSSLILDPLVKIIEELALTNVTNPDWIYDDEVQEILYRLSSVFAIGRRYGQGRPTEPIPQDELDEIRGQVQDLFFDSYFALKEEQKDGKA